MESFDVIIVGGGPSGSTCGWKLRLAGKHTLIIDCKIFPRDKPCAGWITPQVIPLLKLDVREYSSAYTWQPITGFRCGVIGGTDILIDYKKPVSFGIRRSEFDHYLLNRSGSEKRLNEKVDRIERVGGEWVINNKYRAPMLVGAGGTNCPIARMLSGTRKEKGSTVVAQEVEFKIDEAVSDCGVTGDIPSLYFCPDFRGYGWCFRKGNYLNIGLGRTDARNFTNHVSQFQAFLGKREIPYQDVRYPWKGHSYQLRALPERKLTAEGVLLLGDAAGLADAISGEGIRPAIESGLIAAELISDANGNYQAEYLAKYEPLLKCRIGKRSRPGVLNQLPASWIATGANWLLASRWFSRNVLLDRWFLHRFEKVP